MTRHTAKRPAVRVRWELEEYTLSSNDNILTLERKDTTAPD